MDFFAVIALIGPTPASAAAVTTWQGVVRVAEDEETEQVLERLRAEAGRSVGQNLDGHQLVSFSLTPRVLVPGLIYGRN